MIRVLFVCLGNICRSPMAEAIFRDKVGKAGLADRILVDSAGTSGWHMGEPPHVGTRKVLDEHGIDYEGMAARQVRRDDFRQFQYIVAMDSDNLETLEAARGEGEFGARMFRLLDLLEDCADKDVPDPYYTGNFEHVYRLIDRGCDALLDLIVRNEELRK